MPTYIMLSSLTEEGAATLKKKAARLKEVNKEVEGMGVKIQAQYAVLGPFDFVTIIDAPDNETIARVSIELAARGSVKIQTLAAVPIDSFLKSIK
jgi:uncharacterized protein with GYD domain